MSTIRNEKKDLSPGKESEVMDFEKELDALLNKPECSLQEAVEAMTAKLKELRRKYVGCPSWVYAHYLNGKYLIGLGKCIWPQLDIRRKECDLLRRTLKRALRQENRVVGQTYAGLWISADLYSGLLQFSAFGCGLHTVFSLNRQRCQELIDALAPANLDRMKREYKEATKESQKESPDQVGRYSLPCNEQKP